MNQQLVFGILIGLLVVVSAFQAVQLSQLNAQVSGAAKNSFAPAPQSGASAQQSSESVQLPAGITNAPDMVGGC
ncbi:MAG TPA: hypothetical protein VI875_04705 [Candidatus Norongarragalinales archaeon]|nr:hypothetical protein [Candidatus Norongarragalinales archaeon]